MAAKEPKQLEDFERKTRVDLVFWCTDERYIGDLITMMKDFAFNSENVTHGAYGFSFEVPDEEKLLKKLRAQ